VSATLHGQVLIVHWAHPPVNQRLVSQGGVSAPSRPDPAGDQCDSPWSRL
jgi:hypothetical protein